MGHISSAPPPGGKLYLHKSARKDTKMTLGIIPTLLLTLLATFLLVVCLGFVGKIKPKAVERACIIAPLGVSALCLANATLLLLGISPDALLGDLLGDGEALAGCALLTGPLRKLYVNDLELTQIADHPRDGVASWMAEGRWDTLATTPREALEALLQIAGEEMDLTLWARAEGALYALPEGIPERGTIFAGDPCPQTLYFELSWELGEELEEAEEVEEATKQILALRRLLASGGRVTTILLVPGAPVEVRAEGQAHPTMWEGSLLWEPATGWTPSPSPSTT